MKTNITEVRRYIDNAKNIIKEKLKIKNDNFYDDHKYVKMAGHTAYAGVLVALEPVLERKHNSRVDIDDYRKGLYKKNKKALDYLNSAYNYLHLLAGYDGDLTVTTLKTGLSVANFLIDWAEKSLPIVEAHPHAKKSLSGISKKKKK